MSTAIRTPLKPPSAGMINVGRRSSSPENLWHAMYSEGLSLCGIEDKFLLRGVWDATHPVPCPGCQERRDLGLEYPPGVSITDDGAPATDPGGLIKEIEQPMADSEPAVTDSVTKDSAAVQRVSEAEPAEQDIPRGISDPATEAPEKSVPVGACDETAHGNDGLFVTAGLGGDKWGVFRRRPTGSLQRFKSPECPMRDTREEAEADLAAHRATMSTPAPADPDPVPAGESIPRGISEATPIPVTSQFKQGMLPVDMIRPNPNNPRKRFDPEAGADLMESVKAHGVIEPLVVRKINGEYELICGERRLRAAKYAGLGAVPVIVRQVEDDREALELMLVENLQRQDIDPIEEAAGYAELMKLGHKQTEIAAKVNRKQPAIAKSLSLLKLPESVQEMISEGKLSASHGIALGRWAEFPEACEVITRSAVERGLSAHTLEGELDYNVLNALEKSAAIADLNRLHVDRNLCNNCPHKAYHYQRFTPCCFRPECAKEKDAATKAERQRQAEERRSVAVDGASPPEPVDLSDMPYGDYINLQHHEREIPIECTPECSHRTRGVFADGHETEVCLDPACWRKLRGADEKRKRTERKEEVAEVLECWESTGGVPGAALRILAGCTLAARYADTVRAVLDAHPEYGLGKDFPKMTYTAQIAKALQPLSEADLVHLAVECLIRGELEAWIKDPYHKCPITCHVTDMAVGWEPGVAAYDEGPDPDDDCNLEEPEEDGEVPEICVQCAREVDDQDWTGADGSPVCSEQCKAAFDAMLDAEEGTEE